MNLRDIGVLYRNELRSALRERNIIFNSILLPLLLYPVIIWLIFTGITFVQGQTEGTVAKVALVGVPEGHEPLLEKFGDAERFQLVTLASDADLKRDVTLGVVDAAAVFSIPVPASPSGEGRLSRPNFDVRIVYDESLERSQAAADRLRTAIDEYRSEWIDGERRRAEISESDWEQFAISRKDAASGRDIGAYLLKAILPTILILMIALGCFYPAVDTTAGERERATWETTLTLATSRTNVIAAKYLYVATLGTTAGLLNLAAMILSLGPIFASLGVGKQRGLSFALPLSAAPIIGLGATLMAMFIAAMMMIIASFARTFREGQSFVGPVYTVLILPMMFLQSPDIVLTPALSFVPVINVALMFRDAIGGVYRWPLVGTTLLVEILAIVACLVTARRILQFEDVLVGSYSGSFFKFARERLFGAAKPGERGPRT